MQGILCVPDCHLQTGSSPPPNSSNVPNMSVDSSSELDINAKELINQSNQSDSGIVSGTGNSATFDEMEHSNCVEEMDGSDNRSSCSSPDRKYLCPICEIMLTSQHEFTKHIRSHNNEPDLDTEKGFICRICCKVLSSNASLDRHVLIHSGERPFKCTYCGDTFTTNGNMHRHIRTHISKTESYESDETSDSGASSSCKTVEYNNNKVTAENDSNKNRYLLIDAKRKFYMRDNEEISYKNTRIKLEEHFDNAFSQNHCCPVCSRKDFHSLESLEMHLEDNHPDYPTKCNQCSHIFKNHKLLHDHKTTVHFNDENTKSRNSIVGFKDLTFVDFSSEKFPIIARYECEKNLHKVSSGLKFQCEKCIRAFPCSSSLEIHQTECVVGLDLSVKNKNVHATIKNLDNIEKDVIRNDFFARLDLQNKSVDKWEKNTTDKVIKLEPVLKVTENSKDLADIQSIISMTTNGTLLQQLQTKGVDLNFPLRPAYNEFDQNMLKQEQEEESQDLFAAEFRKMKLRGEFPCRLCKAVFPNLRALKGHNRAHFNGNNGGTYMCNMCPHSTVDKAALIRHMRTHNGDRPYECGLCNYAFTTKANCERHLRNRHAKATRDEVKKSIIYHPSEDPSNEDINKMLTREENPKIGFTIDPVHNFPENKVEKQESYFETPDLPKLLPDQITKDIGPLSAIKGVENYNGFSHAPNKLYSGTNSNDILHNEKLKPILDGNITQDSYMPNFSFSPKITNASTPQKPKICVKQVEKLKDEPAPFRFSQPFECVNQPVDMVLDLSTKRTENKPIEPEKLKEPVHEPEDLSIKSTMPLPSPTDILAQRLLRTAPKIDPASLYASQMALYRNSFAGIHGLPTWPFAFNPLLLPPVPPPLLQQDQQELKERLQRLQLCSGGMLIDNFAERLKTFQQKALSNANMEPYNHFKVNDSKPEPNLKPPTLSKSDEIKPLTVTIDHTISESVSKMQSPVPVQKYDPMSSPNSVKMVIKNGVLMPKQKQRRYRTERPFSCEYCSARFTLRSNMERHIKQQHPQFWKQRQRSSIGTPGRKLSNNSVSSNSACDINIPNYETSKKLDYSDGNDSEISDNIKYAILAQHLKAAQNYHANSDIKHKVEEEDDCDLIIDEVDSIKNGDSSSTVTVKRENNPSSETIGREAYRNEEVQDLVSVSRLLDNASQQQFKEYFQRDMEPREGGISEEDEEGLVASGSTSEENSGTDENRSESENVALVPTKKKSAYSLAPNRVSCPYCQRKFPWTSSLRRHVLTHTGQKPFKCSHCPLLFTTKSNCDRHLLRKHGNSATAVNNETPSNSNSYMMRNVPERPFKCSSCPSSTFSTYSNLKKHISCKHSLHGLNSDDARSQISTGYEAGSSEDEKISHIDSKTDWDKQINTNKAPLLVPEGLAHLQNSDLPFKCHLCDNSFCERQDALEHIKDKHNSEYELLLSKNALDASAMTPEEQLHHDDNEDSEVRGKFPDYANRKVICAFCMRRFWSAEDLRRHMRTHTGERPFSCDICHRRFTLKHSMLRHRKKHNITFDSDVMNSDEDVNNTNLPEAFGKFVKGIRNNSSTRANIERTDESDGTEGSDLIGNLLGIRDRSIIDQVLTASADDAAKLLGVRGGERE